MHFSNDPINTIENLVAKNKINHFSIYVVILLCILSAIISLPFINIDISGQSRGMVRSGQDDTQVISIASGKVIVNNLKDNESVKKGDTLVIITTDIIETQKASNDSLVSKSQKQLDDYVSILKGKISDIQTKNIKALYSEYVSAKRRLQRNVSKSKNLFKRNQKLYDKNVISKQEFEQYEYELNMAKDELKNWRSQNIAKWEEEKRSLLERITSFKNQNTQLETQVSDYHVTAPATGTLSLLYPLQSGSLLSVNQTLAIISPDDNLIVEINVLPSDIGWIKKGQAVSFQMDTYNYNQWGMLEGKVMDIDKNITTMNNTTFFRVRCSLDMKELMLKNGYKAQIKKDMTLTARYFITSRSLYQLLFDKVDDWLNPKLLEN